MSDLSLPSINITFKEHGNSVSRRGKQGVVALILRDTLSPGAFELSRKEDIPVGLSDANKEQIKLAMIGYEKPPRKVVVYVINEGDDYVDAQKYLETVHFDYVAVPEITDLEVDAFSDWIKSLRDEGHKKVKAVLPHCAADHEGIINFTTDNIQTTTGLYSTYEYAGRIAGLLAGTPMTIASTFAPLPEVVDVEGLTRPELDQAIKNGEFVIFNDGEKVKVGRGVNSLTTLGKGKQESFKKIKIVEAMDLIHRDVKRAAEDNYLGKYPNSYDNKNLLIVAIQGYLEQLEQESILESGKSKVEIDLAQQEAYLRSKGVEVEDMSDQEIKEAKTGDKVFLKSKISILDAIEDITLDITI